MAGFVERGAQVRRAPVHHVARADAVRAGVGDLERHRRERLERSDRDRCARRGRGCAQWPCSVDAAQADVHPEVQRVAEPRLDRGHDAAEMIEAQIVQTLRRGHAEQQEVPHAGFEIARDPIERRVVSEARVVAEPGNRLAAAQSFDDEQRLDELRDGERRLAHEIAQMRGLPQSQLRPHRACINRYCHARISFCHCS